MTAILNRWLQRPRRIEWELTLGLNGRRRPNIRGKFTTNLAYLDDQGEKWGDTYVKVVGQHYDDYAHWNSVSTFLPMGGAVSIRTFVPAPFTMRTYKGAAPGVTGLIGEVLVTVLLQNVFRLNPFDMVHLMDDRKSPDLCLNIEPSIIADILRAGQHVQTERKNNEIADTMDKLLWNYPIPMECKSRRNTGDRQARNAMLQLLEYWREVPEMAGSGIFAQIDINPVTRIRLHVLTPKISEIANVRSIVTGTTLGTTLPTLPKLPTCSEFNSMIGGRLLG